MEGPRIRCPRLGGEVPLAYCLKEGGHLPCQRTVNCWGPFFPVEAYLRERLTPRQWDECFNRKQKEKIVSLIDLIETAQRGAGQKG